MITNRTPLGEIRYSNEYFTTLVGEAAKSCYGVAAMTSRGVTDTVRSFVRGADFTEKGVIVRQEDGRLIVELHIAVTYGLNIAAAAESISHRVQETVEDASGMKVGRVIVYVDDILE